VAADWWTDERIAQLRYLAEVEGLTCTRTAEVMGTTKNTVVGKARRLAPPVRWAREPNNGGGWERHKAKAEERRADMMKSAIATALAVEEFRKPMGCQFIHGEPKGAKSDFCGAPRLPGKSWCAEHHRVVFVQKGTVDHDKLENWLKTGPILPRDAA
jgi:hypothetical protein